MILKTLKNIFESLSMLKRPSKRVTLVNAAYILFTVFFSYPFLISFSLELYIFMGPKESSGLIQCVFCFGCWKAQVCCPLRLLPLVWQPLNLVHTDDPGLFWSSLVKHNMGTILRLEKKQRPHVTHPAALTCLLSYWVRTPALQIQGDMDPRRIRLEKTNLFDLL